MKRRFVPMLFPYPVVPTPPKKEVKQDPPQVGTESHEAAAAPEELSDRPNIEQYMPGTAYPGPGWDGGMMPMHPLAQAHVRWQQYGNVYNPVDALRAGTVFPELFSPYQG